MTMRATIGWALVAMGGLLVAIASVTARGVNEDASAGARLALGIPDVVAVAIIGLFSLAAVLLLLLLWPRDLWRRRRKKGEPEFEMYHEPPKVPAWLSIVMLVLALLPFAVLAWFIWSGGLSNSLDVILRGSTARPSGSLATRSARDAASLAMQKPTVAARPFTIAVATFLGIAGLASLGVMLWLHFGDRLSRWWVGRIFDEVAEPLREAVAESLEDLRAEPDARRAIVGCYQRFERALAASKLPRAPWQTATEFMHAVLRRIALPREPVRLLTGLFELSRFSVRPLGPTERDIACDCLEEIKAELDRRHDAAAPA